MTGCDYYRLLQATIAGTLYVLDSRIQYTEIDVDECYISGVLTLLNGYQLHIAEYVITEPTLLRTKYRYHLQDQNSVVIARWDNAPHHKNVTTFPHHMHKGDGSVQPSPAMDIPSVLVFSSPIWSRPNHRLPFSNLSGSLHPQPSLYNPRSTQAP